MYMDVDSDKTIYYCQCLISQPFVLAWENLIAGEHAESKLHHIMQPEDWARALVLHHKSFVDVVVVFYEKACIGIRT